MLIFLFFKLLNIILNIIYFLIIVLSHEVIPTEHFKV